MTMGSHVKIYDLAEPIAAYRWWLKDWTQDGEPLLTSAAFQFEWASSMVAQPCITSVNKHRAVQVRMGDLYHTATAIRQACDGPPCSRKPAYTVGHGCGIYAMKQLPYVLMELMSFHMSWITMGMGRPIVMGKVLLGGRVVEHTSGYRAEKVKVDTLYNIRIKPPRAVLWYDSESIGIMPRQRDDCILNGIPVENDIRQLAHHYDTKVGDVEIEGTKIFEVSRQA